MASKLCGSLLSVCLTLVVHGEEPVYWYSVPKNFTTMEMECEEGKFKRTCNDKKLRQFMEAPGPNFVAYVYYETEEYAYDKRVVYTAYVQTMKEGCTDPRDCDGREGANEFDMIETGFVGFNNTWFVNDNKRCMTHWCNAQSTCGDKGCSWAAGSCRVGDYNGCNTQTDSQRMPKACTWTDVQNAFSMCTQSAQLDPMKQDFTVLSANGYLHGETGPTPYGCPGTAPCDGGYVWNMDTNNAVTPVNNRRSYAVQTADGNWGNRWIRLELELDGTTAHYTYRFFKPGKSTDTNVTVASVQKFSLTSAAGKPVFEKDTPHYWVFSIWQYDFEFAVPTNKILNSTRHLHLHVVKDVDNDPTKHVPGEEKKGKRGGAAGKGGAGNDNGDGSGNETKPVTGEETKGKRGGAAGKGGAGSDNGDGSGNATKPVTGAEEKTELLPMILQTARLPFANVAIGSCVTLLVAFAVFGSLVIRRRSRKACAILQDDDEYLIAE